MRIVVCALTLLIGALITPVNAWAWNATGHRVILDLAYERLTPAARSEFDRLVAAGPAHVVEGCPLTDRDQLASWPDCVRSRDPFKATYDEHFDDIALFGHVAKRLYCRDGICATEAIKRNRRVLADRSASDGVRLEALSFLVHFIGDIHQPLHAADNKDRGGNDVKVIFLGQSTYPGRNGEPTTHNLHGLWDTPLVELAIAGEGKSTIGHLVDARRGWCVRFDPDGWARESHEVAVREVYGRLPVPRSLAGPPSAPVRIDEAYVDRALPVVREQMARAAARLVNALNSALR